MKRYQSILEEIDGEIDSFASQSIHTPQVQIDRQTDGQITNRLVEGQTDRLSEGQTDRLIEEQTDRLIE